MTYNIRQISELGDASEAPLRPVDTSNLVFQKEKNHIANKDICFCMLHMDTIGYLQIRIIGYIGYIRSITSVLILQKE